MLTSRWYTCSPVQCLLMPNLKPAPGRTYMPAIWRPRTGEHVYYVLPDFWLQPTNKSSKSTVKRKALKATTVLAMLRIEVAVFAVHRLGTFGLCRSQVGGGWPKSELDCSNAHSGLDLTTLQFWALPLVHWGYSSSLPSTPRLIRKIETPLQV